jgi:hypothetical protein
MVQNIASEGMSGEMAMLLHPTKTTMINLTKIGQIIMGTFQEVGSKE